MYRIRIEAEYQKYFTEGKTGHLWNGDHEILNQFLEIRYSNGKIRNVPTQLHQNSRNAPPKRLYGTVNSPSDILTQAGINRREINGDWSDRSVDPFRSKPKLFSFHFFLNVVETLHIYILVNISIISKIKFRFFSMAQRTCQLRAPSGGLSKQESVRKNNKLKVNHWHLKKFEN